MGAAQPKHPEGGRRQWEAMQGFDSFDRLPNLRGPTLVVHGAEDQAIAPENGELSRSGSRGRSCCCSRAPATCTTPSRPEGPTPRCSTSSGGTAMPDAPDEVVRLAEERADARAPGTSRLPTRCAIGSRIRLDRRGRSRRLPIEPISGSETEPRATPCRRVPSVLQDAPDMDATVHWVCEGWHEDIERAIAAFRAHEGGRSVQYVVADVTDRDPTIVRDGSTSCGWSRGPAGRRRGTPGSGAPAGASC